jgi:hypothetical protein
VCTHVQNTVLVSREREGVNPRHVIWNFFLLTFITLNMTQCTESHSTVVSIPVLYLGGPGSESQSKVQLPELVIVVGWFLKVRPQPLLSHPFQIIILALSTL